MIRAQRTNNKGVALLVVLLIVMTITILSLGFLTRSNVELACGRNMVLHAQMDYLAESGLEHAKALILNPQDIDAQYWTGAAGQQLVAGGSNYYDVTVLQLGPCNYQITSDAYRQVGGERIGRSSLSAELRLDPTIALWLGEDATVWSTGAVAGDVYCPGQVTNQGVVDGDVFAANLSGTITGRHMPAGDLDLQWPRVTVADFTTRYAVETLDSTLAGVTYGPYSPARVCYSSGDLQLSGNVEIHGMLVVEGDLVVSGAGNIITAAKNVPAVLVTGDIRIKENGRLDIYGLGVVDGTVKISSASAGLDVAGGLFVQGALRQTAEDTSGSDNMAVLYNGPTWRPAGGQIGGGALEFDGVDDFAQTSDDASRLQLTGDYTLAVWVKPDAVQKSWAGVFSKCSQGGLANHWTLQFNNISPKKLVIHHASGYWDTGIRLSDVAGAWHHIRVVRKGDSMTSYLDGSEMHSNTWSEDPGSGLGHFNIGADRTMLANYTYKGLIDDIRIYNRAPDANEVYPQTGLVGHWKLDEQGANVSISAEPSKTAIVFWSETELPQKWSQAADAFYRSIERQ